MRTGGLQGPNLGPDRSTDEDSTAIDRLVEAIDAQFEAVDRVVGSRVVRWIEDADLGLRQARVLLTLGEATTPWTAAEVADRCGLDLRSVYSAMQSLRVRGMTEEDSRRHALSDYGRKLIDALHQARGRGVKAYVSQLNADERRRLETALDIKR